MAKGRLLCRLPQARRWAHDLSSVQWIPLFGSENTA